MTTVEFTVPPNWVAANVGELEAKLLKKRKGRAANLAWMDRNAVRHRGFWVVISDGKLLAKAPSKEDAISKARRKPRGADIMVYRVPTLEDLSKPENIW